jgi:glycosyltransferase involved in cell wall biosynthesis
MSRLKVVHAAKFYPPVRGGMETVVGDLCDGTAAEWDVRVVAANDRAQTVVERRGEVEVARVASYGSVASVPMCPSFATHLWRQPADCVVLHEPNPVAGMSLLLRMPARRLVVWHHSDLLKPWWAPHTYGRVQRALYQRAESVIVSSPNLADQSALVQQARRVVVIPFGISLERYRQTSPAAANVRANWPGRRVLFVGRLVYYKGVEVLIDAMTRVQGTLLLIGGGPLEPELRRRAAARGIQDRVVFLGHVPEDALPAYYQAADVFVLPSVAKTEAFGVVQVEAMAAGVPVISTNLPTGVPWVNEAGVSGLVVAPGDPAPLADAIAQLLADGELRGRLGRNASERANRLFSRDRMIGSFRDVIERAVREPERTTSRGCEAQSQRTTAAGVEPRRTE